LNSNNTIEIINRADVIFWDFDGVIKDSVNIKTEAFREIFSAHGESRVVEEICVHHELNSGLSRFIKMPYYLELVGQPTDPDNVNKFCDIFANKVFDLVVNSEWVPGVIEYIRNNYTNKSFFLVTAIPKEEINNILKKLLIYHFFNNVYGYPDLKDLVIQDFIKKNNYKESQILMIGDSMSDYKAAKNNSISFLLRRTQMNQRLIDEYHFDFFDNLSMSASVS